MKTFTFIVMALAALLLVGWQHQQLGSLRAEKSALELSATEMDQLKADLARATGNEGQDAEEIERLRGENHDLLKLRNEVNQLRETKGQFEKVKAENERLKTLASKVPSIEPKSVMQPIVIQIGNLSNRGLNTPEDAVQTFYWAVREESRDSLSRIITSKSWNKLKGISSWSFQGLNNIVAIEIVARHDVDATTVQMGMLLPNSYDQQSPRKSVITLVLEAGEWRVDMMTGN